jgi:Ca-activated chloride channel family protein
MYWGESFWLWWLFAAPALALLMLASAWLSGRRLAALGDAPLVRSITSAPHVELRFVRGALAVLAAALATLALARPQWGVAFEEVQVRGIDLVLVVDVSNSMLAEDVKPSRVVRARLELRSLVEALQGNRIGLVAFAGDAWLLSPLTLDYGAVQTFLDMLEPPMFQPQGTAIGKALEEAVAAFGDRPDTSKVVLLVTDGEDLAGNPMEAVRAAKEKGIVVHTVGLGSFEGTPIPEYGEGGMRRYKRDQSGRQVETRLDETFLMAAARETGGLYLRASTRLDAGPLSRAIASMATQELDAQLRRQYTERYQWFLGFALLCLFCERTLAFVRPKSAPVLSENA